MEHIFKVINDFFEFIVPISDFLWDFPTNIEFYSNIPILGKFSFALILLVGTGIFFSVKTKFVQITKFKTGLKILIKKKTSDIGVSPLASFLLSSATRVGPGNIMGVTGAISVGGPGQYSGCGYLHFSEWLRLLQNLFWHRFSKNRMGITI